MIGVDLYWRQGDEELALGKAYLDTPPPVGALLAYVTAEHPNVVWRVDSLYIHPAQPGSMAVVLGGIPAGRHQRIAVYSVFVSPAEGPHAPDSEDRP